MVAMPCIMNAIYVACVCGRFPKSHKSAVTQPYLFMNVNWITQDEADLERKITCTGVGGGNGAKVKRE